MTYTDTEKVSEVNFANIVAPMEGWCSKEKAQKLFQLVLETDSQRSIELGVFGGRSLVPLGYGHKTKGSGFVIGIDPWNNRACIEGNNDPANDQWWLGLNMTSIRNSCEYYLDKYDLNDYCSTIKARSVSIAPLFPDGSIDLLHQDGNHNTDAITSELKAWASKIKVGGYWIADDTNWPTSQEGYSKLPDYGFELLETHSNIEGTEWQVWKKVK